MTELVRRKRRLVLETPFVIRGRAVIAHVEAGGLVLSEKGSRSGFEISWAQIYNRAAEIAAEGARRAKEKSRSLKSAR